MIDANNPQLKSFIDIAPEHDFPIQNLPFGIFSNSQNTQNRVGVAIGDFILDLDFVQQQGYLTTEKAEGFFKCDNLNALMAEGRVLARDLRNQVSALLRDDNPRLRDHSEHRSAALVPMASATLHHPVAIAGYTDFYSSKQHATNIGTMFRDKDNPLLPNWLHVPVAYDGRANSVVVSGTDFHRPWGQTKPNPDEGPQFNPCRGMDVEVEMGLLIGRSTEQGDTVSMAQAPEHAFGMVLVNDWSARDIQKWEYVPLGPFLGKNFCTSISPWVVTLDALEPFRCQSPKQEPNVQPYLQREGDWAIDVALELAIQSKDMDSADTVARMNFKEMYWDICQQVAHHSVNGCALQTGDLLASGTISGDTEDSYGSFIELTWGGKNPITLSDGTERKFLQDHDTVIVRGHCQGESYRVGFGEVVGTVLPAKTPACQKQENRASESVS